MLDRDGGELGDRLGVERLWRDQLGLLRSGRLPGGHHAGVGPAGRVQVPERVRSRREVDLSFEPSIADRAVPTRGGNDLFLVDQEEAGVLARSEEAIEAGLVDVEGPAVLAQERLRVGPEGVDTGGRPTGRMPTVGARRLQSRLEPNPGY